MINIRKSLFETSSSSTHAICIGKSNNDLNIPDELTFYPDYFGWDEGFLHTTEEKASYLYTAILCKYLDYADKTTIEVNHIKNNLYELLGKHGCEATFKEPRRNKYGWTECGIDHCENIGTFLNKVLKSEKTLLRYLFSPNSFIVTGNDNSDWFYDWEEEFDKSDMAKKVDYYYKGN